MSLMDEKDNTLLERGADNDIVRLRWRLKIRENIIGRLVAENERLRDGAAASCETVTLTDEERAAIEWFAEVRKPLTRLTQSHNREKYKDTLCGLLERLK
jgi:hypothetical protein